MKPNPRTVEARRLCKEIAENAQLVPDAGAEFADSVLERSIGIRKTIHDRGMVTDGQLEALHNMHRGLQQWLDNEYEDEFDDDGDGPWRDSNSTIHGW